MPGWELYDGDERDALDRLFHCGPVHLMAHGGKGRMLHKVREFEDLFATRMGVAHAQAVSSGSAALKVALQAAGVKPGDEVITSCFTFIATVEAILEVGARPVLVDVDETLNANYRTAFPAGVSSETKAWVPVHMLGECVAMPPALPDGIAIIEDACQAIGASYRGKLAGTLGTLGAYSFDGGKTLCCGEGGMVVTNDHHLWATARCYHDHGHSYDDVPRGKDRRALRGFNYRMTEMQAAVGIAQLRKLDFMIMKQRKNKAALVKTLGDEFFKRWPMRRGADPAGDAATSLVFFCDDARQAGKFVEGMAKYGLATMNLPDALDWHFAERWVHLRNEIDMEGWPASRALLERAIALPIMINWTADWIEIMAAQLKAIARGMA